MKKADFSRHSIADIRFWKKSGHLELQPDYQRRLVWSPHAQIMLIDSILKGFPLPKIFIASSIRNGNTHKRVIDGQQRTTAILAFLLDKFSLEAPYDGPYSGKKFSELPEDIQNLILNYRIDFNEFENYTEIEIREIYNRVNKYTVALNKQELRRADFPGGFLTLSEQLSNEPFFDDAKIFTPANRRRMLDVEFISELLAIIIADVQDKKTSLDEFYIKYAQWVENDRDSTQENFDLVITNLITIFDPDSYPIARTRFRQKSDFYSLFAAIHELVDSGCLLHDELLSYLREDLGELDQWISPDASGLCGEYAIKCVSDANSRSSREWRKDFLKNILLGAYDPERNDPERLSMLTSLNQFDDGGMCRGRSDECSECGVELEEYDKDAVLCFPKGRVFFTTSQLIHQHCLDEAKYDWVVEDA